MKRIIQVIVVCALLFPLAATLWPVLVMSREHKVSPLHRAAYDGDNVTLKRLLDSGMDVNIRDDIQDGAMHKPDGGTPLHRAARAGRLGATRILLEHGAQVNGRDYYGQTPLHWAAMQRDFDGPDAHRLEVVKLLLSKGADVNAKDREGRTPLHNAAEYGLTEVAKVLLQHGADYNALSGQGSPLTVASQSWHADTADVIRQYALQHPRARSSDQEAKRRRDQRPGPGPLTALVSMARILPVMLHQHKARITSTHTAVLQHLAEIRQIIAVGKSPAGAPLAPLSEPTRRQLLAALDSIAAGMDDIVDAAAPEARKPVVSSDLAGTIRWVTVLLRTVTDMVRDLQPDQLESNYGKLGEGEGAALQAKTAEVLHTVKEAAKLLRRR